MSTTRKKRRPPKALDAITVLATLSPARRSIAERYITELAAVEKERGAATPLPEDSKLMAAFRKARFEGEASFAQMYQTVFATRGVLELLIEAFDNERDNRINWDPIGALLQDYRRRLMGVSCALGELEQYERDEEQEAADIRMDEKVESIIAARERAERRGPR